MLTIVTTHPIQYQAPIWKELALRGRVPFEVIFLCDHGCRESFDPQFGKVFRWDGDLLEGYASRFVARGRSPSDFWSLRLPASFWVDLSRARPKAIWIQGWQVAGYWEAALLSRALGVELWLRGETNLRSGANRFSLLRDAALRALFSCVGRFLCIGTANRDFYLSLGVGAERLFPAPYCVDNKWFRSATEHYAPRRNEIREEWGIPAEAFCFLFVGKFIEKKRPADLIRAAKLLSESWSGRRLHLAWVGSGDLDAELRSQADECFEKAAVGSSFLGFLNQSEIAKAYCAADCLVLPSEADETWGLVVNEAMATGLPAIISDACGSADDLALPGRQDLLYPCADVPALAESMRAAIERRPHPDEIARKIADYDILRTVETVEELYLRIGAR